MKTRLALSFAALAVVSGCAGTPTWDTSVFPEQVVYGGPAPVTPVAAKPIAAMPIVAAPEAAK